MSANHPADGAEAPDDGSKKPRTKLAKTLNSIVVGMFNAATLYFSGGGSDGKKNPELGTKYMRLAAYSKHTQAIDYCKKNNIPL
ncbi:13552_t:CDS:2 [Funneliformis mosseae]|uniref:13552_t:CDS:1 n=1 Tax=Funneliformis mosseae TaxID=27381 RepID=A0A9N9FKK5_FUNMO|nr:13552_t:CDS:2 [Funneliformis mosseae]